MANLAEFGRLESDEIINIIKGGKMSTYISAILEERSRGFNPTIIVEDAIMGTGKSQGLIEEFKKLCKCGRQFDRPVIVVLRYLDEIDRFKKKAPGMNWYEPSGVNGTKASDLKSLLKKGCNILTTHRLFESWDVDIRDAICLHNYQIVIDEVVTCLKSAAYTPTVLQEAERAGLIQVKEVGNHQEVIWTGKTDDYDGAFEGLKDKCSKGTVLAHTIKKGDAEELIDLILWTLPSDFFKLSDNYKILTYGFEFSYMAAYFKLTGIKYTVTYPQLERQHMIKRRAKELINIVNAPKSLNKILGSTSSLCHEWYKEASDKDLRKISEVINNNLRRRGVKLSELIYACPKTYSELRYKEDGSIKKNMILDSYGKYTIDKEVNGTMQKVELDSYLSWATLGTNMYDHCTFGLYLHNVFANVGITTFLQAKGIAFDDKAYATHCLVQWVWRLAIRKDEPEAIEVMIPNQRMRNLFKDWLDTDTQSGIPEEGCTTQYKLLSPEGRVYVFSNIAAFCRCHGLDSKNISKLLKGEGKTCKGWTRA